MIRDASPFKQDPLDIPAVERISLDRVRAPRVEGACPLPHARWDCVERVSREEFLSEGLEYGFIHLSINRQYSIYKYVWNSVYVITITYYAEETACLQSGCLLTE